MFICKNPNDYLFLACAANITVVLINDYWVVDSVKFKILESNMSNVPLSNLPSLDSSSVCGSFER